MVRPQRLRYPEATASPSTKARSPRSCGSAHSTPATESYTYSLEAPHESWHLQLPDQATDQHGSYQTSYFTITIGYITTRVEPHRLWNTF